MGADDDQRPVAQHPDLALRQRAEGAANADNVIDPRLQGRRHGKIVHRRTDHDKIGSFELCDQPFRQRKSRIAIRHPRKDRLIKIEIRVGRGIGGEIALDDLRAGVPGCDPGDNVPRDLPAERLRPRADQGL